MSPSIVDPSCANSSRAAAWRPAAITLLVGSDVTSVHWSQSIAITMRPPTSVRTLYQPNEHISEFRETARQSRLSILAQGPHTGAMSAEGYPPPNNRKSQ